jgi:hypothetical protein
MVILFSGLPYGEIPLRRKSGGLAQAYSKYSSISAGILQESACQGKAREFDGKQAQ